MSLMTSTPVIKDLFLASQPPSVLVRPRAETLRAAGISLGPAESWAMAHTQSRSLPHRWQRICGHKNHGISWDMGPLVTHANLYSG